MANIKIFSQSFLQLMYVVLGRPQSQHHLLSEHMPLAFLVFARPYDEVWSRTHTQDILNRL